MKFAYLQFIVNLGSLIFLIPLVSLQYDASILATYLLITNIVAILYAIDLSIIPVFISRSQKIKARNSGSSGYILSSICILTLIFTLTPFVMKAYARYFEEISLQITGLIFLSYMQSVTANLLNIKGKLHIAKRNDALSGIIRIILVGSAILSNYDFSFILYIWAACLILNVSLNMRNNLITNFQFSYQIARREIIEYRFLLSRNLLLAFGSISILHGAAMIFALHQDSSRVAQFLLSLKLFQVIKNFSQVPVTFSLWKLSRLYHKENKLAFKRYLKSVHSNTIHVYLLLSIMVLVFDYLHVMDILGLELLPLEYLIFILVIQFLELNHGNMSQIYIITFSNPFVLGSILSGLSILALNYLLSFNFSVTYALLIQFFVQLCWNNWYPAYVVSKKLNTRIQEFLIPVINFKRFFLFICFIFRKGIRNLI